MVWFALRSDHHHRWVSAREGLLMQGIPSYRAMSFDFDVCSFSQAGRQLVSRAAMMGQAGNAMHSQAVAIIWLFCLTQCNVVKPQVSVSDTGSAAASVARLLLRKALL